MKLLRILLVFSVILAAGAHAHEARPIYFQISEQMYSNTEVHQYTVNAQIPTSIPNFTLPELIFPEICAAQNERQLREDDGAYVGKQIYSCSESLTGQTLNLNFPAANPSVTTLIRLQLGNGQQHTQLLKPGQLQWQIPERENIWNVARDYTWLGITHIWAGVDHLLFVACLLFIAGNARRIIITITGFTLAHSVTLFLATLQWVQVPVPPVEAVIALSIVFLAHEMALDNRNSWTFRYPIAVSTSFGLLHGFGFAAVLGDLGLPQTALGTALLFFNVGVEIGQLLFIVAVLALYASTRIAYHHIPHTLELSVSPQKLQRYASYPIGVLASYWMIDRLMGF